MPLLFSFERRIRYITRWKEYLPAVTLTALLFLIKDAYFTYLGIWGFSESFITGIKLYTLPLEEILFFFVIPYSSLFLHEINKKYSIITFSPKLTNTVTISLLLLQTFLLIFHTDKTYTWVNAFVFVLI
ncbi:lycopene cyclase domain-containing protein, partial [candidate division WWE3 bacterium]|nr:lycopene cyclase domain-containing protein [candidate division WWE3 bacterium]